MAKLPVQKRKFKVLDYKLPAIYIMPRKPKMGFLLWLYGSNSFKEKHQYRIAYLAEALNIPVFCFDYSGHGEAPFSFDETTPAQHFLEVITIYDELCAEFGCGGGYIVSGSYGGYLHLQLLKYRKIVAGVLGAPAIYRPSSFYTRWENLMSEDEQLFRSNLTQLEGHPLITRAGDNTAPLLIIEHGADDVIPSAIPKLLSERLAHADYVKIDDLPHAIGEASVSQQDNFNKLVADWLKKH